MATLNEMFVEVDTLNIILQNIGLILIPNLNFQPYPAILNKMGYKLNLTVRANLDPDTLPTW